MASIDNLRCYTGQGMLHPALESVLAKCPIGDHIETCTSLPLLALSPLVACTEPRPLGGNDEGDAGGGQALVTEVGDAPLSCTSVPSATIAPGAEVQVLVTICERVMVVRHAAARRHEQRVRRVRSKAKQIFFPSLAHQRRRLVSSLLRASRAVSWLDLGCGDGTLLAGCLRPPRDGTSPPSDWYVPTLRHIAGIDINALRLKEAKEKISQGLGHLSGSTGGRDVAAPEVLEDNCLLRSVQLVFGSFMDPSVLRAPDPHPRPPSSTTTAQEGVGALASAPRCWDVVSCVEVIEHLESEEAATRLLVDVLRVLRPAVAVFTTPNNEVNDMLERMSHEDVDSDALHQNCAEQQSAAGGDRHTNVKQRFRELDHKFEFSRPEFHAWAHNGLLISKQQGYELTFAEVGQKMAGGTSFGGATQIAIFRLTVACEINVNNVIGKVNDHSTRSECCQFWNWNGI